MTPRSTNSAPQSMASSVAMPTGQAEMARVFELGADEGLVIPRAAELGRAGRWRRGRCPGRTVRQDRPTQPGARPGLGHRLPQLRRYRRISGGLHRHPRSSGAGTDRRLERAERRLSACPRSRRTGRLPGPDRLVRVPALKHSATSSRAAALILLCPRRPPAPRWPARRGDHAASTAGIAAANDIELPTDWAYLAIAHARKGEVDQARRWLDRLPASSSPISPAFPGTSRN